MGFRSWLFGDDDGLDGDLVELYDAMDPYPDEVDYDDDDLDDTAF